MSREVGWVNSQTFDVDTGNIDNDAGHVDYEQQLNKCLEIFDFKEPLPDKRKGIARLFYNNCNGLAINNTIGVYLKQKKDKITYNYLVDVEAPTKVDSLLRQMKVWDVDIVQLSETNVAWENKVPRRVIQKITQRYDMTGSWTVASSNIDMSGYVKPGGAGILTLGTWTGHILDRGVDPHKMGRWAYVLLGGSKTGTKLLLITGYRTGKRSGIPGERTAWSQQRVSLMKSGRQETPTMAFISDIKKWLKKYKAPGVEIVLTLDANEQWTESSMIAQMANELNLKNLTAKFDLSDTHPNLANINRSTTIDYCLCSPRALDHITFATSTPYSLETLGDHRGIVLDMNLKQLLGTTSWETNMGCRKLTMKNPQAVDRYLKRVDELFTKQNIFARSQNLLEKVNRGHSDYATIIKKYEAIDKEVYGICVKAEKKCKPTIAGRYAWSPRLDKALRTLRYWRYRARSAEETAMIKKLGAELDIPYVPLSSESIQQMISDGKVELIEIQTKSREVRQEHLETIAQLYADQNNISQQQAVVEIMSHEETRDTFRDIRSRINPITRSQLRQLWVSSDEAGNYDKNMTTRKVYSDKESIHQALLNRNADHLQQASTTPFARGELQKRIKWDSTGSLTDDILSGEVLNEIKFSASMQLYMECLKVNDLTKLNLVTPTLLLEDYKMFWKKKRETTVTSPFGLHVGHYKAALSHLGILNVHRCLLLIPFKTGFVPTRWRRTVQTMLEKEQDAPWIHRLRIIELFDAQANAGFQIFVGRNMMRHAVTNKLLQAESFGSTPGKMATSALVQKLITIDQLRIERRAGGIFDCDASGCYDRIIPPLASIHLQALGLHRSVGIFLARLMFQARRHVKTSHGVSKQTIITTKKQRLHGIGQGNGGGPAMWIAHLTVMFAAISSVCIGFAMTCVNKISQITSVGTGYVDDVTLGLSVPRDQPQTGYKVYQHIKKMGQLWERLLYITGGRLELSKCFWVNIIWKWKRGLPFLVTDTKIRTKQLYLKESESREYIQIPLISGKEAIKRLGVWSSCDGKWSTEVSKWIEFSTNFGRRVRGAGFSRVAGELAYKSVWLAKFRYSAAVIGYSQNQLKEIQSKITGPCIAAAGYSSKMPRSVIFGPVEYGGLEWDDCLLISIYEKLKLLIGSIRLQDKLGRMLEIQLTWLQLFAGSSTPLLEEKKYICYLPEGWIKHLHKLLVDTNITVEMSNGWYPKIQRSNDRVIMDIVQSSIPVWAWDGINRCRLYLQALTVADITTSDGKFIPEKIRKVTQKLRYNRLLFPIQTRPTATDIKHWDYFINLISSNGHLHTSLGRWVREPDQQFPHMITEDRLTVYKLLDGGEWSCFKRQSVSSTRFKKQRHLGRLMPRSCLPVYVIDMIKSLIVLDDHRTESEPVRKLETIYDERRNILVNNVLGKYQVNEALLHKLQGSWNESGVQLVCATDGGLKNCVGTSSYAILFPGDPQPIISGMAGELQRWDHSSITRQELIGQLGIEMWLEKLVDQWGVPRQKLQLTLVTDSQVSIDILQKVPEGIGIKDMLQPEMDIALEIYRLQQKHFWTEWQVKKVESHIDRTSAPDEFFWDCNDIADQLATKARDEFSEEDLRQRIGYVHLGTKIGCKIGGVIENNQLYKVLKLHINGRELKQHLMEKNDWTDTIFESIDWVSHKRELVKIPQQQKVTTFKYIHGWLATNVRKKRERCSPTDTCTLCGQVETQRHLFRCSNDQMSTLRTAHWKPFCSQICSNTASGFKEIFLSGLNTILGGQHPNTDTQAQWPSQFRQAYAVQTQIGWEQVLYGRLAQEWDALAQYRGTRGIDTVTGMWTRRAIKMSLKLGTELWTIRNQLVHGSTGEPSKLEKNRVHELIQLVRQELLPELDSNLQQIFFKPLEELLLLPHQSQLAWLGKVKFCSPRKYKELEKIVARGTGDENRIAQGLMYRDSDVR